jgi:hypothetical protein
MPAAEQFIKQGNYNILHKIEAATQGGEGEILPFWQSRISLGGQVIPGDYSGFLQSLRLCSKISSLEEKTPPNVFEPEQTELDRFLATKDFQWKSPRFEFELYLKTSGSWILNNAISLQNYGNYYQIDLLPYLTSKREFLMQKDLQLGFSIKNVGFGRLGVGDWVSLVGAVQEQVFYVADAPLENIDQWNSGRTSLLPGSSGILVEGNVRRRQLYLINDSPEPVYLAIGREAELGKGIRLNGAGGSLLIQFGASTYTQAAIHGISAKSSAIAWCEGEG